MLRFPALTRSLCLWLAVAVWFTVSGCDSGGGYGGPTGTVTGTVTTAKGEPVPEGSMVTFVNESKSWSASGKIGAGGQYSLLTTEGNAVPAGDYKVIVNPPQVAISPEQGMEAAMEGKPLPGAAATEAIPEKYRTPTTSPLSKTVKEGENTIEIKLE